MKFYDFYKNELLICTFIATNKEIAIQMYKASDYSPIKYDKIVIAKY